MHADLPSIISGTITDASGVPVGPDPPEAFWKFIARPGRWSEELARWWRQQLRPYIRRGRRRSKSCVRLPTTPACQCLLESTEETSAARRPPANSRPAVRQHGGRLLRGRPEHIRAVVEAVRGVPTPDADRGILPLERTQPLNIDARSLFVQCRRAHHVDRLLRNSASMIDSGDYAAAVDIARQQVGERCASHRCDMDEGMLDSQAAMVRFLSLIAANRNIARVPVMIDSSKWSVIEAGLKCVQGRSIVNSNQPQGRRGALPRAGAPVACATARPSWSWPSTNRAGGHHRPQGVDLRACLCPADDTDRIRGRGHHFRSEYLRRRHGVEEHNRYSLDSSRRQRPSSRECPTCTSAAA